MKLVIDKLLTLFLFIVAIGCFYVTFTMTFASLFINFVLFFVAIFFLIQGCGMFDKIQGYGQYSDETVNDNEITTVDGGTSIEENGNENYENNDSSCNENDDYSVYD